MKLVRWFSCAAFALTVVGCGQNSELTMLRTKRSFEDMLGMTYDLRSDIKRDVEAVRTMPLSGSAFNRHLHSEYLRLTEKQITEGDRADARRFLQRAVDAGNGELVYPEEASTRHFEPAKAEQMRDARDRLLSLLYRHEGAKYHPDVAAHAQAMFDCWQEEEDDGGVIEPACRTAFEQDLVALAPRDDRPQVRELIVLMATPDGSVGSIIVSAGDKSDNVVVLNQSQQATQFVETADKGAMAPGTPFAMTQPDIEREFADVLAARPLQPIGAVLRFENNSLELTAESKAQLPGLLAEIGRRPVPDVVIKGHADRAGSPAHNDKLSELRARSVRKAVIEAGVPANLIQMHWYGESDPVVPTADGVGELRNRRVEITVR
jgi:OOP family OmpA-OmpF porin